MGEHAQEQLTRDIENTRGDLSRDLDELTDKVSPARVVERRVERARGGLGRVRERVMGSASDTAGSVSDTASSTAGTVTDAAGGAAGIVKGKTEGNPLAAGLIAFGVGWLVSSLIPVSEKESQLASAATEAVRERGGPLMEEIKGVGQEIGTELKDKAAEAASSVKDKAAASGQTIAQEAK